MRPQNYGQEVYEDWFYDMETEAHSGDVNFKVYWIWQAQCYNLRVLIHGTDNLICGFPTKESAIQEGRSYFPKEEQPA